MTPELNELLTRCGDALLKASKRLTRNEEIEVVRLIGEIQAAQEKAQGERAHIIPTDETTR